MDLATYRKSRGLSQDDLAAELGYAGKSYISQLETGAAPVPLRLALQIQVWSGGAVPVSETASAEDLALLDATRPLLAVAP